MILSQLAPIYTPDGSGELKLEENQGDRSKPPAFLSGGGGLVSTAVDYARFCQMLLNGCALGATGLLGRKTVELMTANHWPRDERPFAPGSTVLGGNGFGLGMRTMVDVARSGMPSSTGEYGWGGADGTYFWIDPREQMIGLLMVQVVPMNFRWAYLFQVLACQALVD